MSCGNSALRSFAAAWPALALMALLTPVLAGEDRPARPVANVAKDRPGPESDEAVAALRREAAGRGSVKVVVTLAEPGEGGAPPTPAAKPRSIAAAQDALARRIRPSAPGLDPADRLETQPVLMMQVDGAELERLLADPAVAAVQLDRPVNATPRLAEMRALTRVESVWPASLANRGRGATIVVIDNEIDRGLPQLNGRVVFESCHSSPGRCHDPKTGKFKAQFSQGEYAAWGCLVPPEKVRRAGEFCNASAHGNKVALVAAGAATGADPLDGFAPGINVVFIRMALPYVTDGSFLKAYDVALREARKRGAKVITTSIGDADLRSGKVCDGSNPALERLFAEISKSGVLIVNSAGNDSEAKIDYPGCASNVLAVGASTEAGGEIARFSDTNALVDFLAPGDSVRVEVASGASRGTSYSAPSVAASVALLARAFPNRSVKEIVTALRCTGERVQHAKTPASVPLINVAAARTFLSRGKPQIFNRFDGTKDLRGWALANGGWGVAGGMLALDARSQAFRTSIAETDQCFDDFDAEIRARQLRQLGAAKSATLSLALGANPKVRLNKADKDKNDVYVLTFFKSENAAAGSVDIVRMKHWRHESGDGQLARLCSNAAVPVAATGFVRLGVSKRGSQLTLLVNGKSYCTATMEQDATESSGVVRSIGVMSTSLKSPAPTIDRLEVDHLKVEGR